MSDFAFNELKDDDDVPQSGDRLRILSAEEYELLWGFPRFTQSNRDPVLHAVGAGASSPGATPLDPHQAPFFLHLGYFRARQRFFRFELPAVRDYVGYLRRRYFDNKAVADLTVSDHTRQRYVEAILGLFRYRLCAIRVQLIRNAVHRNTGVDPDLAPLGIAGEASVTLPTAHGPEALGGEIGDLVLLVARMRFREVLHAVVVEQEAHQPVLRLGLGLRFV